MSVRSVCDFLIISSVSSKGWNVGNRLAYPAPLFAPISPDQKCCAYSYVCVARLMTADFR